MSKWPQPIEKRYINVYSTLTPQEWRQLRFKERYKNAHPKWDDSTIRALAIIRNFLGQRNGVKVLDAGCGRGNYLLDETRSQLGHVEGVDGVLEATIGNRTCDHVTIAPLEALPFPDNSFDLVTGLWIIEHLQDPAKVFSEITRVLRPGGLFLALTPNADSILLRVKRLLSQRLVYGINRRWYGRDEQDVFLTHYKANTKKQLLTQLQQAGFISPIVEYNTDPSYTSWNTLSYWITTIAFQLLGRIAPSLVSSHLVIAVKK